MVKRFSLLAALLVAAPLSAGQVTKKFDWNPSAGAQDIHVETDRVVVSQLQFDMGDRVVDAISEFGFIPAGARVRIVSVSMMRIGVEPAGEKA